MTESEPVVTNGYLDGVLAMHYNECDIAASDAARLAHELLDPRDRSKSHISERRGLHFVGHLEPGLREDIGFVTLAELEISSDHVIGRSQLVLTEARRGSKQPVFGLLVNHDTVVPLATFERRDDGTCSYMQIGAEIDQGSVVATPDSPRNQLVEEIRALLASTVKGELGEGQYGYRQRELEEFVTTELKEVGTHIDARLEHTIARLAETIAFDTNDRKVVKSYVPIEGGEPYEQEKVVTVHNPTTLAINGSALEGTMQERQYSLRVGVTRTEKVTYVEKTRGILRRRSEQASVRELVDDDSIRVFLEVRGGATIDLLQFTPDGSVVLVGGFEEFRALELSEQRAIYQLIKTFRDRQTLDDYLDDYALKSPETGLMTGEQLIGKMSEKFAFCRSTADFRTRAYYTNLVSDCGKFVGGMMRHGCIEATNLDEIIDWLLTASDAEARLERTIGPGDSVAETIIAQLEALRIRQIQKYIGELASQKIGKTHDDVGVTATIRKHDDRYEVVVKAVPMALEGHEDLIVFDETLHIYRPNDQEKSNRLSAMHGLLNELIRT